jgi:thiopurine S-methyltransferase
MDENYWHERWQRGEIGFHLSDIHPALKRHWSDISGGGDDAVLVPLSGKSLDMRWLSERGHRVIGVELSERAIAAFFEEWGRRPERDDHAVPRRWRADGIELVQGDFFDYRPGRAFRHFYDRAALIALPSATRPAYLRHLRSLLHDDATGLLVTFEYDQQRMDGPPFSVPAGELAAFDGLHFEPLDRRQVIDDYPGLADRGLATLHERSWRVTMA